MHFDYHSERITLLLAKFIQNTLSPEEKEELQEWMEKSPRNKALALKLKSTGHTGKAYNFFSSVDQESAWQKVLANAVPTNPVTKNSIPHRTWWYSAAAVFAILLSAAYFLTRGYENPPGTTSHNVLLYDEHKALLTLEDGTLLALETFQDGVIYSAEGIQITKKDKLIAYTTSASYKETGQHTLSTSTGSQYQLLLPDQTKVWLNATSSLTFPAQLSEAPRIVRLNGEGYFEVASIEYKHAPKKKSPFRIITQTAEIEVLGTIFNVSAYENESIHHTTLLEGSVKVARHSESIVLQPGQQAQLEDRILVKNVDPDEIVSWKNGYFQFDNQPLDLILNQLQRWYGFRISADSRIPEKHFSASISRDKPLSTVLQMLELSGDVKFEFDKQELKVIQRNKPTHD